MSDHNNDYAWIVAVICGVQILLGGTLIILYNVVPACNMSSLFKKWSTHLSDTCEDVNIEIPDNHLHLGRGVSRKEYFIRKYGSAS